jgi:putative ABC transport system permease protein
VAGDVKQTSLAIDQLDAVYLSTEQTWVADDSMSFLIRTRDNPAALAPAVKSAIWSVDRNQVVALMLAAVGIYGVLSGNVAKRTREIGVRAALGASRGHLLALILGDGMRLTALGIAIGLCGAVGSAQGIRTLLFGTSPLAPIAWTGVVVTLVSVSAIACSAPAWRASRVDPSITLRAE